MKRMPLPDGLPPVYLVSQARSLGVTASRLRAKDIRHPHHGLCSTQPSQEGVAADARLAEEVQTAAMILARGQFFSHVTSARVWGIPLPPRYREQLELDVASVGTERPPRGRGIRGHRVQPGHASWCMHPALGVPVATPAATWVMLGAVLRHPYDLVAAADSVLSDRYRERPAPLAALPVLRSELARGRRVGLPALRVAVDRARLRVASRPETWTRLTLVDGLLPEPETNVDLLDAEGAFVACVDLAYHDARVAIEYEGEQHLTDRRQWHTDIERYERLHAAGWYVVRVTSEELFRYPATLVRRVDRILRLRF